MVNKPPFVVYLRHTHAPREPRDKWRGGSDNDLSPLLASAYNLFYFFVLVLNRQNDKITNGMNEMPAKDSQKPPHCQLLFKVFCRHSHFVLTGAIHFLHAIDGMDIHKRQCIRGIFDPCLVSNRNTPKLTSHKKKKKKGISSNAYYLPGLASAPGITFSFSLSLLSLSFLVSKLPSWLSGNRAEGNPNLGPSFFSAKSIFCLLDTALAYLLTSLFFSLLSSFLTRDK